MQRITCLLVLGFGLALTCVSTACNDWDFWDACKTPGEARDLEIHFVGFEPYVGQDLYLRMLFRDRGLTDATLFQELFRTSKEISSRDFRLYRSGGALSCMNLRIEFFVDVNENGEYDSPPTDHAWRIYEFTFDDPVQVDFAPNTDYTDLCGEGECVKLPEWP